MHHEISTNPALWYPALSILTFLAMAGQYAISILVYEAPYEELFDHSEEHQLDKYETSVSPYYWTHYIWIAIYVWQGLWVCYAFVMNCRRGKNGPRFADPVFLPAPLFVCTIGQCACHVVWRILMDRNEVIAGFVVIVVYAILLYLSLGVSYYAMAKACAKMYAEARAYGNPNKLRSYDVCLIRLFLFNSLGLHAGWVTVVALLHLAKVMIYEVDPDVSSKTTATVFYCSLLGLFLIFALIDLIALQRISRYTITPYIAVVYSMVALVARYFDGDDRNSILAMITLAVTACLGVIKLIMLIYYSFRKPPQKTLKQPSIKSEQEPEQHTHVNNTSIGRESRHSRESSGPRMPESVHVIQPHRPDGVYQSRIVMTEAVPQPRMQHPVYHEVKDKQGRTYILY